MFNEEKDFITAYWFHSSMYMWCGAQMMPTLKRSLEFIQNQINRSKEKNKTAVITDLLLFIVAIIFEFKIFRSLEIMRTMTLSLYRLWLKFLDMGNFSFSVTFRLMVFLLFWFWFSSHDILFCFLLVNRDTCL